MLSQEPKDGDFIRYVDALQAGKLAEIKAENRHLEMHDLSDAGWSKRVTAYLARGAKRVEPAASVGVPTSGRKLERRHQLMLLGFACLGIAIVLFVVFLGSGADLFFCQLSYHHSQVVLVFVEFKI